MRNKGFIGEDKKFIVLVIYDISDDKRRNRMAKLLKGYGYRVQKSVFECRIDNGRYNKLIRGISKIHDENDLVRVYMLCVITSFTFSNTTKNITTSFTLVGILSGGNTHNIVYTSSSCNQFHTHHYCLLSARFENQYL